MNEQHQQVEDLIRELEGWQYNDSMSDDARRKVYLMQRAATHLRRLQRPLVMDEMAKMLTDWASLSKGLKLYIWNGEVADFDNSLAGTLKRTAHATLNWRDGPGSWDHLVTPH